MSRQICDMFTKCCSGNNDSVQKFVDSHSILSPPPPPPPRPLHSESQEDDKMEEEEGVSVNGEVGVSGEGEGGDVLEPMEDADEEEEGWTVVRKSGRKSKH